MFTVTQKPFKTALTLLIFSLALLPQLNAQSHTNTIPVSGVVYDAQNREPLSGATVKQEGTTRGAVTQDDGSFQFRLSADGSKTVIISFLGFKDEEIDLSGQNATGLKVYLYPETYVGDEVFVQGVRVDDSAPITYNNVERAEIEKRNLGQDVPYLLQNLPSVTTTSDAGAGVGYTGIRIRGVDPARINVTINGIPVNDAESHGVFWVDLPDLASSIQNIQVQRGVGTSTNGAGAFGGSINLQTSSGSPEPFGEVNTGFGSFNTRKYNVRLGSGLMQNGWQFEGRLSKIDSDGFIDRASSDLSSFFLSAAKHGERSLLKADVFTGKEITYQAWYGVSESMLEQDRTFNEAGTEKDGSPYEDQVDDYQQNYYQLHYSYQLQDNWTANASAFYTKGFGYYEEYKAGEPFEDYGIEPVDENSPTETDLVRRRWLDNDFYGLIFSSKYAHNDTWNLTVGGGVNEYKGAHFGEVIWARYAGNSEIEDRFYDNDATKNDYNMYAKLNAEVAPSLNAFLDVQLRAVEYNFLGNDYINAGTPASPRDSLVNLRQDDQMTFFNPKAGLVYIPGEGQRYYASFGVGSKEPTRDEYVNSTPESRPDPEKLYNVELGYRGEYGRSYAGLNLYGMFYKDQLVLTGQINDVGEYIRQNVDDSYRMGVELQAGYSISRELSLGVNATFSRNKIVEYTQYTDSYAEDFSYLGQQATVYEDTDIAFSPSFIGNSVIAWSRDGFNAELVSKYVSKQYLDNTQTESRSLDAYFVNDLRLTYALDNLDLLEGITATLQISNLFNHEYETNGYTYGWLQGGDPVYYNYYYPQAGTNFLLQLKWEF